MENRNIFRAGTALERNVEGAGNNAAEPYVVEDLDAFEQFREIAEDWAEDP
jgi:hypothetical protein